jgi:hypothetical protein
MKKYFFVLFLILSINIWGQELDATVQINSEQLQNVYKENLVVFKNQIEDYLNNTKFTRKSWEWSRIQCSFNVFFTAASDEINYTAQVVINSSRAVEGSENRSLMVNIMDNKWSFIYEKNQSLYFNITEFNQLTSFLDFYALVIIGMEADSYEPFGGTTHFQEALQIALMGASSGFTDSWGTKSANYYKRGFIEDATGANFQQLRQDIFDYHYNGIDLFVNDKMKTQKSIVKLIDNLFELITAKNIRSPFINSFFDAKSGEMLTYLEGYEDTIIYNKLIKVDPAHTSKYIDAQQKAKE